MLAESVQPSPLDRGVEAHPPLGSADETDMHAATTIHSVAKVETIPRRYTLPVTTRPSVTEIELRSGASSLPQQWLPPTQSRQSVRPARPSHSSTTSIKTIASTAENNRGRGSRCSSSAAGSCRNGPSRPPSTSPPASAPPSPPSSDDDDDNPIPILDGSSSHASEYAYSPRSELSQDSASGAGRSPTSRGSPYSDDSRSERNVFSGDDRSHASVSDSAASHKIPSRGSGSPCNSDVCSEHDVATNGHDDGCADVSNCVHVNKRGGAASGGTRYHSSANAAQDRRDHCHCDHGNGASSSAGCSGCHSSCRA